MSIGSTEEDDTRLEARSLDQLIAQPRGRVVMRFESSTRISRVILVWDARATLSNCHHYLTVDLFPGPEGKC